MAASNSNFHVRSNSFPSKSHPLLQQCNEHLERLRSSSIATSSSSITKKLGGVEDLFDCVIKLLQLQFTQQAFAQSREEKWVDQIIDGSLRLLDICSVAKDAVMCTKDCTREIQSSMRRKHHGLEIEINKYLAMRKVVKKMAQKALMSFKSLESKALSSSTCNQDDETNEFIVVLREVEAVTLGVFESLLSFISGPTKLGSRWSLVLKLLRNKSVVFEEEESNEFASVDASLHCSARHENLKEDLQNLDLCIQDFEEILESLFRRLIKNRVSLLNILNN